jgi:hypothetical protein
VRASRARPPARFWSAADAVALAAVIVPFFVSVIVEPA